MYQYAQTLIDDYGFSLLEGFEYPTHDPLGHRDTYLQNNEHYIIGKNSVNNGYYIALIIVEGYSDPNSFSSYSLKTLREAEHLAGAENFHGYTITYIRGRGQIVSSNTP